jgi:hypothetical protein
MWHGDRLLGVIGIGYDGAHRWLVMHAESAASVGRQGCAELTDLRDFCPPGVVTATRTFVIIGSVFKDLLRSGEMDLFGGLLFMASNGKRRARPGTAPVRQPGGGATAAAAAPHWTLVSSPDASSTADNGTKLATVASADTSSTQTNTLNGVSCPSSGYCMAAGIYFSAAFSWQTLTEQW